MDSYTLLRWAISLGHTVKVLTFDYDQRHSVEIDYASNVCHRLGIEQKIVDITFLYDIASNSALTNGGPVPEGHYTDATMKQTVVPNRNMVLTSIAISHAINHQFDAVWLAQHSGDHDIYPDCRPAFVEAMDKAARLADWHPVRVEAPFLHRDKQAILELGESLGLRAKNYADTWTCYNPQHDLDSPRACGKCGSCTERLEAFDLMGWTDPLEYAA